jgi:two-component system chemotaxis response regulator CheY
MKSKTKIYIICVDDEAPVLEAVERVLAPLEDTFPIESASNVDEARAVIAKIIADGHRVGLIFCDHLMPGTRGVDFLIELNQNTETIPTRKILLTGQAGHQDTIEAINHAGLNHYISKPWNTQELLAVARKQLTEYVLAEKLNPTPYLSTLDAAQLTEAIYSRGLLSDR